MWLVTAAIGLIKSLFSAGAASYTDVKKAQIAAATEQAKSQNVAVRDIGLSTLANLASADQLAAKRDIAWGAFSPLAIVTATIAALFAFHGAGIVFDSMPLFGHVVGSWRVEKLPGMWEQTEHVVLQSLFYGASTAVAGGALIKAIKR
jgi:hypothetical protein